MDGFRQGKGTYVGFWITVADFKGRRRVGEEERRKGRTCGRIYRGRQGSHSIIL